MRDLLDKFIYSFFKSRNKVPSRIFLESSRKYLEPTTPVYLDKEKLENLIKSRSYSAYLIYKKMQKDAVIEYMCYILASVCYKPLIEELSKNIKRGALGFDVSYYNDTKIMLLKDLVDTHIYGIAFQVYQNACIYKKLKKYKNFGSKAHLNFYEIVRKELEIYEEAVINQENDMLGFYAGMYTHYIKIQIIHQLNECFFDNPKKPFDFLRLNFYSNHPFYSEIIESSFTHLNACLKDFLVKGDFTDPNREFFITKNVGVNPWDEYSIDYDMLPYFISQDLAQKILYIGKCVYLLKKSEKYDNFLLDSINDDKKYKNIIENVGLESPNLPDDIEKTLFMINEKIKNSILTDMKVYYQIEGIRQIFLFGRSDFIESLFQYLKEAKRINKKSLSCVLDAAIRDTFNTFDIFTASLGVYLTGEDNQYDAFAPFYQAEYPMNLILSREVVLKLVTIFRFLWKIKRIQHLIIRALKSNIRYDLKVKLNIYNNILYKIIFYICEEVVSKVWKFGKEDGMILENLKVGISEAVEKIISFGFIDDDTGLKDFISYLELSVLNLIKNGDIVTKEINEKLNYFLDKAGERLVNTVLFDLYNPYYKSVLL